MDKKQKLKEYIEKSKLIEEKVRQYYLSAVDIFSEEKIDELIAIFEEELKLDAEELETISRIFKEELKREIQMEESREKEAAENILLKLNEV